jgi:hypothetical protein
MHTRSARRSDYAPTMWAVIGLAGSYDEATPDVVSVSLPLDTPPDGAVPLDTPADTAVPVDTPPDGAALDEPSGLAIELILPSEPTPLSGLRECQVRLHAAEGTPLQLVGFYLGTDRLAEKAVSASSGWSELTTACDFSGVAPGSYTLTAVVQDRSGDRARVQRTVEVVGAEEAP